MDSAYSRWLEIEREKSDKQKLKERMNKLRQTKEYQTPKPEPKKNIRL